MDGRTIHIDQGNIKIYIFVIKNVYTLQTIFNISKITFEPLYKTVINRFFGEIWKIFFISSPNNLLKRNDIYIVQT